MNRPLPHRLAGVPVRTDGGVDIAPCLRPGETQEQFRRRVAAEEAAHQRLLEIYSNCGMENTALAAGVGNYDGNGNPKGSGWW